MNKGQKFGELVRLKPNCDEPCKMISRPFLQALGYKPDYVVIVPDSDRNDYDPASQPPGYLMTCTYSMPTILQLCAKNPTMEHIKTLAEGPGEPSGPRNQVGQLLTQLCLRLASKGFFSDPKYFPCAPRDMRCLSAGMSVNDLRLRKLFKVV